MKKTRRTQHEIMQQVGPIANYVRKNRKRLGYTQEEFAWRAGVGMRFLRELEQGKTSLRMDKVMEVLAFLGAELIPMAIKK